MSSEAVSLARSLSGLRELGQQLRVDSIRVSDLTNSGHPTSSMSAADPIAVLFGRYLRYHFDQPKNPLEAPAEPLPEAPAETPQQEEVQSE